MGESGERGRSQRWLLNENLGAPLDTLLLSGLRNHMENYPKVVKMREVQGRGLRVCKGR